MKKLLLIDANSLIHRCFHALPPLTAKGGQPTGALYGLAGALLKIINPTNKNGAPDYAVAAFDRPEPTFRKEMFEGYKAHRPKAPDELISQIIEAHTLFNKFHINYFEKPSFEADDIIGTFVKKFKKEPGLQIVILTGDLDTLQLVEGEKVVVDILKKGISETMLYDEKAVIERYGLKPAQMADYKGLVGDASDNIPGVRGVGPKTAEKLLLDYGDLENLFNKLPGKDPMAKKVLPFKKEALFSKKLATINCHAPIQPELKELEFPGLDKPVLTEYFGKLGFESLIRRLNGGGETKNKILSQEKLFPLAAPETTLTEGKNKLEVAWDWKSIFKNLIKQKGTAPKNIFDLSVAGWILNPDGSDFSPTGLAGKFLTGKEGAAGEKEIMDNLFSLLLNKIKKEGLDSVYYKIEMPLIEVLAWMETWGIRVEKNKLENLLAAMGEKIEGLTKKIYAAAGELFNINSSRQVAEVIFDKLKIKPEKNKRTGTGRRSTSEDVLISLAGANPIIQELLAYRETFKIKSTYVEPLLRAQNPDKRVRTNFIQTGTSTGRLASEKPNLQNIPQESEWSKELRDAFTAAPGFSFASFDYAQLELRLLAHVTMEEKLIEAFGKNLDIHTLTASRVLKIPFAKVTHAQRRLGKTLNFGVVYGMGPRAFSQSAGVSLEEARKFIDDYYREFPKIKKWQEEVKNQAVTRGYVENLNGRKRWFWTDTEHPRVLGEIERAAVNMPLQSLGADILKTAMIKSFTLLKNKNWLGDKARLILTIHDELLFEIQDDILKEAVPPIKDLMEGVYPLAAPLSVEARIGKNWGSLQKYQND